VAQVNPLTREVLIKLVYYGPGLGGKTTTLQKVHAASPAETRGKIVSLATPVDRTLYFDFMPLRVEPVHGYPVRLQLFTVPGQVYFNATRKLVLTGADGVVFVADSKRDRQDANLESLQNLAANLQEQGRSLTGVPHVMQYNKRDLEDICSVDELNGALNPQLAPHFESRAAQGEGVIAPLDELVRMVLLDLEKRAIFGNEPASAHGSSRFSANAEGLRASLTRASEAWEEEASALQLNLTPRELTVARGNESSIPARRSTPARGASISALPGGRLQSSEPPRVPAFDGRPGSTTTGMGAAALSFSALFPAEQAKEILQLEQDLARADFRAACLRCDGLFSESLAEAADALGLEANERPAALVALALGMSGDQLADLRSVVKLARSGGEISEVSALSAYGALIEINRLRLRCLRARSTW